jgi:hypothetical protein
MFSLPNSTTLPLIGSLLCFGVLGSLAFLSRNALASRRLAYFRVLFPSWRFFDELGGVPSLFYRTVQNGEMGPWQDCLPNQSRNAFSFLLNPTGNLRMASLSLVEQLVSEIQETDENQLEALSKTVPYLLTRKLVIFQMKKRGAFPPGQFFQFKIMGLDQDVLVSKIHSEQDQ